METILLGNRDHKNYYLASNILTKEKSIIVDNLETGKRRIYTNSRKMRDLVCMFL